MDPWDSSSKADKSAQIRKDYEHTLIQSWQRAFTPECAKHAKKWLEYQVMSQMPETGNFDYLAGYTNAIKTILGFINNKG